MADVAVVGAGIIGLSWAALFAAHDHTVRVWDPRPDLAEALDAMLGQAAPVLGRDPQALQRRVTVTTEVTDAVAGTTVVQESAPERLELKHELYGQIESAAPADALVLSSTSGILPTDLAGPLRHPQRFLVAHPFNPPHVLPLVELVPGRDTAPDAVAAAAAFYRGLGRRPVVLHHEVPGFVGNRLQSALFREAVSLVQSGVVSAEEVDAVVTGALGPRWATAGPFESFHLGGGPGGLRHFFEHLGPGMARRWQDLGTPALDEQTVRELVADTEQRFAGTSYEELVRRRDARQAAVVHARAGA